MGIYKNTGVNCFWIINNSQQVINAINKINDTSKARYFDSYDFSTSYTNIPHDSLKNCLTDLVDMAFRVRGALYIVYYRSGKCAWSKMKGGYINISKLELTAMIEYLVDNIYVHVGNKSIFVNALAYQWARIVLHYWPISIYFTLNINT